MALFKYKINSEAPVKCSKSILINSKIEKVWTILTEIDNWSYWQKDISFSKLNGPLQINSTFTWKMGGTKIHSTLHTIDPLKAIGWTGKTMGLYAIHNWIISEIDDNIKVEVEESMEGFLASYLKFMFNPNLEKGMIKWLEFLKNQCEK